MEKFFLKLSLSIKEIQKKYKILIFIIKIVVSVSLVAYLVVQIDFKESFNIFSNFSLKFFFLTVLFTFLATIFYNLRYFRILLSFDKHVPFWELYLINRFSNLINFFLPGGIGQEIGRVTCISEKRKVVVSSLVDRFVGLFSIVIMLLVSVNFTNIPLRYALVIVLAVILSLVVFLYLKKHLNLKLGMPIIWSFVYTFLLIILVFFQFKIVGVNVDSFSLLFFVPLLNILLMFPISVNGYGLREFFWFVILGISADKILVYSMVGYFINLILSLPGLVIFFREDKNSTFSDTNSN